MSESAAIAIRALGLAAFALGVFWLVRALFRPFISDGIKASMIPERISNSRLVDLSFSINHLIEDSKIGRDWNGADGCPCTVCREIRADYTGAVDSNGNVQFIGRPVVAIGRAGQTTG